ncbi:MAG: hypothetical protein GY880_26545 [Planctomycetaceae bacterium]|nr:hypothetical protein [Planctomycetaceae bacterium]
MRLPLPKDLVAVLTRAYRRSISTRTPSRDDGFDFIRNKKKLHRVNILDYMEEIHELKATKQRLAELDAFNCTELKAAKQRLAELKAENKRLVEIAWRLRAQVRVNDDPIIGLHTD